MKLLTKTSLNFISASVIFFLLGSVAMYFSVRNIIAEDLQNRLLQQQKDFFYNADQNNLTDLSSKLVFIKITDKEIIYSFSDTVLIVNDSYILYRKLQFPYLKDEQYYNVSILKNQSQSDSLIKKIVIMNVGFAMLFFLIMFFVNRHSIKSALSVFYSTIRKLEDFELSKLQTLTLETAEVQEIKKLNEVFEKMATQIYNDFEAQKEYTENVSHEIQTPLAIISSKADELLQSENLKKEEMEQLEIIMNTTTRLAKINQALILLTKIDNRFYTDISVISIDKIIHEKLDFFSDLISEKKIILTTNICNTLDFKMNRYLADTLFLNIIKIY